jgi:hypothetical protein
MSIFTVEEKFSAPKKNDQNACNFNEVLVGTGKSSCHF